MPLPYPPKSRRSLNSSGQTLVELLLAVAVASILLPALITGFVASREGKVQQGERLTALSYLKEMYEAGRSLREKNWSNIATNGIFHTAIAGSDWLLSSGSETINGFTRQLTIADALRDSGGTLVDSGGTIDPSTKKITLRVAWSTLFPSSVSQTLYLTRFLGNANHLETTETDFSAGTKNNVAVTNTSGGEVQLGAGGRANWCEPKLNITPLDLPKQGVANAISAIEGRAFAGTGENASGVSFANVTISNTDPPLASLDGTLDGYKTNGLFGENNYVYLATDTNNAEIVIFDLTKSPYTVAGTFDSPGSSDATGVYVAGNTGYMSAGDNFYTFDLSSKTDSRPQMGSVALAGPGAKIYVKGNYAYVAIGATPTQLQIIDVTNPRQLSVVASVQANAAAGVDVITNSSGTRAYLVTQKSDTQKEFFIFDTSNKSGNLPVIGSYDTSGMNPKGVTIVTGNRAIVVGSGAEEYQVIDISSETSPVRCGGLSIDNGVNGVASVLESDGDAYSYIITGEASSELRIIEGGPGGKFSPNGTFESATFALANKAAFNRLNFNFIKPNQTDLKLQVALTDPASGNCADASFNFVGPDGTATSYFTANGPLPVGSFGGSYINPGRCLRYKAYLTSNDTSQTPALLDVRVNYSP